MNETGRVEAFSDGVFAIAVTLLILEIKVPHETEHLGTAHECRAGALAGRAAEGGGATRIAEHLTTSNDRISGVVYAASFFVISIVFQVLWGYAMRKEGIVASDKAEEAHAIHRQYRWGPLFYVVAILIAR